MNLVTITQNNEAVTTSLAIAEGTEVEHKAVIQLVRNYQSDLEEFGPLTFEMAKGKSLPQGGFAKSTEYATLNEDQATLLMTYMRNSEIVRSFKKRLVKDFRAMHTALQRQAPQLSRLEIAEQLVESIKREEQLLLENKLQQTKIEEDAPKLVTYEKVIASDAEYSFAEVSGFAQCLEEELTMCCKRVMWLKEGLKKRVATYAAKQEGYMKPKMGEEGGVAMFTAKGVERILQVVDNMQSRAPQTYDRIFGASKTYGRKFNSDSKKRLAEFAAYITNRRESTNV